MALFNILVDIASRTAGLEQGVKRVEEKLSSMEGFAKNAGLALTGAFSVAAIGEFVKSSVDAATAVGTAADRMGVMASELSKLKYAAEQSDVSFESLTAGIRKFQDNIATGGKGAEESLTMLGLSIDQLKGKSLEEKLGIIADKFRLLTDADDRTRISMDLFGKAGNELIPMLDRGSDGMAKLSSEAASIGIALDDQATKALDRSTKAIDRFFSSIKSGTSNYIGTVIADIFGSGDELLDLGAKLKYINDQLAEMGPNAKDPFGAIKRLKEEKASIIQQIEAIEAVSDARKRDEELQDIIASQNKQFLEASKTGETELAQSIRDGVKAYEEKQRAMKAAFEAEVDSVANELRMLFETNQYYAKIDEETMTAAERAAARYVSQLEKIDQLKGRNSDSELDARRFNALDEYFKTIGAWQEATKKAVDDNKKSTEEMSEQWKTFTRNAQSSLANFLYDPFKDGLDGMLMAFVDLLRRIAAEAAAAKIFDAFGSMFGGSGRSSSSGGADFFGTFLPALVGAGSGNKSVTTYAVTNNVTVGAGSNVTRGEVVAAMKQSSDETIAKIQDMKRRGRF